MTRSSRPRRSVLYMPGARAGALAKAKTLPADALILDLEDAVGPAEKAEARRMVAEAVQAGGYGLREVTIRINGLDTEWGRADLEAACAAGPDAIVVPKVNAPEDLFEVESLMESHGAPAATTVWAMIETPLGVLNVAEIAGASPRLSCLVMGTNDLVKELSAAHTPDRQPVAAALGLCVLAARAHGVACLDGVYNAFRDQEGLRAACAQGRDFGFDGKTLIHPDQLAIANEVFAPSEDDIALAERYVAAFAEAEAAGKGVAVVDGRLVENLHVETARSLLARADAIRKLEAAG